MPRTVLLLHSSAGRYGADLQLLAIVRGLDRSRWAPVCVLPERGELAPLLEQAGAHVVVRDLAVLRRAAMSPTGLVALRRGLRGDVRALAGLARERRAALVHSNTSVVLAGARLGLPHLLHVREIYKGAGAAPLWPLWRRRLLRADVLACVSRAVAEQFAGSGKVVLLHDGLARVPHPAPRARARVELELPEEAFVVALLGRVSDWKGQDVLARALAQPAAAEAGVIGLVAGDAWPGEERHERALLDLAGTLGLGDRLRVLGFREDVDTVLGAADAVVVPSTRPDPFPNSALEAAAAGLPVVAAAHGGLPEIVRDGETGLLVPPGEDAALAVALARLAGDRALTAALGATAAADAGGRFGPRRMVAEVEALYERLARPG